MATPDRKPMERAELERLLEQHHLAAYGWALNCCSGDPEEASEVLQTAYLNILERRARFGGRSSFKTWLFAVVRNTAVSWRRRLRRRVELLQDRFSGPPAQGPTAAERVYRSELRKRVNRLLSGLSSRQQQILELVFYHEMTLEEAAQVMGVAVGSARVHYQRGKARLRQQIQEAGLDHEFRTGERKNQAAV